MSIYKDADSKSEVKSQQSDQLANTAVRGGGAIAASRILGQITQVATTMVLARLLLPDDFGVVAMVVAVVSILHIFNDLGFVDATIQTEKLSDEQSSNLFWLNVIVNVSFFAILSLISVPIARFYNDKRVVLLMIVISTELIFLAFGNQHFALLKREMVFGKVALIILIAMVLSNILAIISAILGAGYWALVVRQLSMPAIRAVCAWIVFRWRPKKIFKLKNTLNLVWFGLKTSASLVISHLSMSLPRIMLGRTVGTRGLAFYDRSYSLMMLPVSQMSVSFHHVAISTLRRSRDNPTEFQKFYLRAISTLSFVAMPLGAILSVLSEDVINIFLGPGWEQAVPLLSIFSLTIGLRVVYMTNSWLHVSLGKAKRRIIWEVATFSVIIIGVIIALPFGLNKVAWVIAIAPAVLVFPGIAYAGKPIGLSFFQVFKELWRCIISAGGSGFILYTIMNIIPEWTAIIRLISGSLIGLILYLTIIIILHGGFQPIHDLFKVLLKLRKRKLH